MFSNQAVLFSHRSAAAYRAVMRSRFAFCAHSPARCRHHSGPRMKHPHPHSLESSRLRPLPFESKSSIVNSTVNPGVALFVPLSSAPPLSSVPPGHSSFLLPQHHLYPQIPSVGHSLSFSYCALLVEHFQSLLYIARTGTSSLPPPRSAITPYCFRC